MFWWLVASILLNVFLFYAWMHDTRLLERSRDRYEQSYHDTLDSYMGNPRGTTMKRLTRMWPEDSELREKSERKYLERYGDVNTRR